MRAVVIVALLGVVVLGGEDRELKAKAEELVKSMASKDVEERLAAVRAAARVHHRSLMGSLIRLIKDKDARVRMDAIAALGMRDDPKDKKSASKALYARLKPLDGKEETRTELLGVIGALHDLAAPNSIRPLLDGITAKSDPAVVSARLMAVANIASKEAIERLIKFGDMGRRGWNRHKKSCWAALRYATGASVKGGVDQWRDWWRENKSSFDLEAAAERRTKQRVEQQEKASRKKKKRKGRKKSS